MSKLTCSLFLSIATLFAAATIPAQHPGGDAAPAHGAQGGKEGEKKVTFAVVAVGDELKVLNETAVAALQKEKKDAFAKAMQEYEKNKKEAEAAKKKFEGKPPHEVVVEVKRGGFATEADAKKYLEELQKTKSKGKEGSDHGGNAGGEHGGNAGGGRGKKK